ncbi:hypothetical protein [Arthrobacter roseus]|uniref:hypothetical protein n=1 Tax=Arthrobacter roseus TaxID=136274 RepID=UPI0019669305|nr:hypothetical protein [Arthrobacter roseus]MBM7847441.1 hypothetical protein [Arthrobacter roseus]
MRNADNGEVRATGDRAQEPSGKRRHRGTWSIIVAAVVSVVTFALGWLQLHSAERAVGMRLPDTMFGGYDAEYIASVKQLMDPKIMERYQSVHYFWDLLFPLAFASLIILIVRRFAGRNPLRWVFYLVAVVYAAVDIAENFALEAAFNAAGSTDSTATLASVLTTGKFILFVAAVLAFVLSFMLNRPSTINQKVR